MRKLNKMRTLKLITIGIALIMSKVLSAQVSVNVNIGSPPQWGPVGYTDVRYYYLPDVEAYYDIHTSMFIYFGSGAWIHRSFLPVQYSSYDLYYGYKVVINNYYGSSPYIHFKDHKVKYKKGYRGSPQKTIGNKPGKGNSNTKEHSEKKVSEKKTKSPSQNTNKTSKGNSSGKTGSDTGKSSGNTGGSSKDKSPKAGGGKKK
jgi:hypothetical protein